MLVALLALSASAAEPDVTALGDRLDAIETRNRLPIVVATPDPALTRALAKLDRQRDDLSLVLVTLEAPKNLDRDMKRVLAGRGMRCGVWVREDGAGAYELTEYGTCGVIASPGAGGSPAATGAP